MSGFGAQPCLAGPAQLLVKWTSVGSLGLFWALVCIHGLDLVIFEVCEDTDLMKRMLDWEPPVFNLDLSLDNSTYSQLGIDVCQEYILSIDSISTWVSNTNPISSNVSTWPSHRYDALKLSSSLYPASQPAQSPVQVRHLGVMGSSMKILYSSQLPDPIYRNVTS